MEESSGAQYALQVALQTLRDRCQQFQQRIADLEDENLHLRSRVNDDIQSDSLPEIDALHLQISQLNEQKSQLSKKVEMVTLENNNLWTRLTKLAQVKENLDLKLSKINDTICNRSTHTNLVRSKTFTQDEPHIKLSQENLQDENEKISLDLEDISLKLLSSIAKEKYELEMQCSQMAEMQSTEVLCGNSYAFVCPDVNECDQLEKQLTSLKTIKFALLKQKEKLEEVEASLAKKPRITCASCILSKNMVSTSVQTSTSTNRKSSLTDEETTQLQSLMNWGTPENSLPCCDVVTTPNKQVINSESCKICPMCSKIFYNVTTFDEFQEHVEKHFLLENATDYEVI